MKTFQTTLFLFSVADVEPGNVLLLRYIPCPFYFTYKFWDKVPLNFPRSTQICNPTASVSLNYRCGLLHNYRLNPLPIDKECKQGHDLSNLTGSRRPCDQQVPPIRVVLLWGVLVWAPPPSPVRCRSCVGPVMDQSAAVLPTVLGSELQKGCLSPSLWKE